MPTTATVTRLPTEALDRVARYADRLANSADMADEDTLTVAADLAAVYEAREWVTEWEQEKPIRPDATGRPTEPDSRNRFGQWLVWKLNLTGHPGIMSSYTYRLLNAHEVHGLISPVAKEVPDSEYTLRPLDWFRKQRLHRFIPEVWADAVELADGGTVTHAHTRAAVLGWKKANRGQVLVAIQSNRMERDRIKAKTAVEVLMTHARQAQASEDPKAIAEAYREMVKFNDWVVPILDRWFDEVGEQ